MSWVADSGWLRVISEYLIKSTAVLTLALVLVFLFRRKSASLRHFVLSLSLAGLLLLPVLSYLGSGWETSLLPAGKRAGAVTPAALSKAIALGRMAGDMEEGEIFLPRSSSTITPAESFRLESMQAKPHRVWLLFKSALPIVWSAGLIILLLRLAAGLFGAFRLTRQAEVVCDPRWRVLLERLLAAIRLRRVVRLKSHRDVLIPMTWGFMKPVVLIPEGHEAWTDEQRSSALVHELSHVKRLDFLAMLFVRVSLAAFWFNPLSWAVFRRLKREQEEACDEWVLRTGIKPSTYAANLLFFKTTAGLRPSHFAALLGLFGLGKSAFTDRLAAILKQKWVFQEVKMKTKMLLSCAVILAVGLIGMARPSGSAIGEAEPVVGAFVAAGPSVLEKTSGWMSPVIQKTEQSQKQSQAEEKKAQEQKQKEQAQKEQQAQEKQAQEKKEQAQERKEQVQEEQEQKEHKKEAIVWTIKEGEKHKHQIKIQEGEKVKTITVGKPIVIKEKDGKNVIFITPEGKEVKVLEGDPVHLEIIGDRLQFIKEGKVIKLGEDGSSFYVSVKPDVDISKAIKIALKDLPVTAEKIALAKPHISWVEKHDQEEIREKVREIREKLKKVEEKELELRVVEEALADLEKDLEKMSQELSTVAVTLKDIPVAYTIAKKTAGGEAHAEVHVDIAEGDLKDSVKVVVSKDGMFKLVYLVDAGEKGRETYEKIVARVKKDLPQGFSLDPEFDEESGRVTLKISGPDDKETPKELVKKITESIRDERKEKKE